MAGDAEEAPESVSAEAVTVVEGETSAVEATITPTEAAPALAYEVEDDTIAEVLSDGTVVGVKAGSTKGRVKSMVRPLVSAEFDITVSESV